MRDELKTVQAWMKHRLSHRLSRVAHRCFVWGGAGSRKALCLALICFAGLQAGCRRPAALPPAPRYVRIETLLPLHPAWAQTQALERIAAGMTAPPGEITGASAPLPAPFPFAQATRKNLADERQKRIRDDAEQALNTLAASLFAGNAQRLARETLARQRQTDAQYRRELAAKVAELAAAAAKKRAELNSQITRLGYIAVAYESQGRIFIGASQQNAKDNLKRTNQQIDSLTAQRDAIPSDFRSQAMAQLRTRRAELNRAVADFRQQRARELAAELQDQLAARSNQRESASSAIKTFGANLPAASRPAEVSIPAPDFHAAHLAGRAQIRAALTRQQRATNLQREQILSVIRADTEQAVQQIAARENWKLVAAETRGATDATDDAAKALREQWKALPAQ